ncbi:hypothetical protein ABZY90_11230 [Streptomyces sp. NPDC006422]|uniref:hypothetical protein n=1 Tax=unclassified Streptomyces TaxID=2593676 RepID=UPI0033B3C310
MSARSEYTMAHRYVVQVRGKANVNACAWCGATASDWAYDWRDPKQREADGLVWSDSTAYYFPLCRADHRSFDAAYRRVGLAGLDAEVERLKPLAWARVSDERREVEAKQRTRQFEINESVIAAHEARVFARHDAKQARIREQKARQEMREAARAMTRESSLLGFFPGVLVLADESDRMAGADAYGIYAAWCQREAIPHKFRMGRTTFYRALEERGVSRRKRAEGITLFGIKAA